VKDRLGVLAGGVMANVANLESINFNYPKAGMKQEAINAEIAAMQKGGSDAKKARDAILASKGLKPGDFEAAAAGKAGKLSENEISRLKSLDLASGESGGLDKVTKEVKAVDPVAEKAEVAKKAAAANKAIPAVKVAGMEDATKALQESGLGGISKELGAYSRTAGEWINGAVDWFGRGGLKKKGVAEPIAPSTAEAKPTAAEKTAQATQQPQLQGTLTLVGLDKVLFKGNLGGDVGATPAAKA
jgi:hypothetical protein